MDGGVLTFARACLFFYRRASRYLSLPWLQEMIYNILSVRYAVRWEKKFEGGEGVDSGCGGLVSLVRIPVKLCEQELRKQTHTSTNRVFKHHTYAT